VLLPGVFQAEIVECLTAAELHLDVEDMLVPLAFMVRIIKPEELLIVSILVDPIIFV